MRYADTAADYRQQARLALTPSDGLTQPSEKQLAKAAVLADLAISAAISEAIAADTTPAAAIHHSH